MKFTSLPLMGAYLIELEPHFDERGYFVRNFCKETFDKLSLRSDFIQISTSFNRVKGQIRGMHFQAAPFEETKIVRCLRGSVYDVIVDLRETSETYMKSYGEILSAENKRMLYIPKGFAHGYKTLESNTELLYMMDAPYKFEAAREISPELYFTKGVL